MRKTWDAIRQRLRDSRIAYGHAYVHASLAREVPALLAEVDRLTAALEEREAVCAAQYDAVESVATRRLQALQEARRKLAQDIAMGADQASTAQVEMAARLARLEEAMARAEGTTAT